MKILVVEDIGFSQALVERYLQNQGHEVLIAKCGREALTLLEEVDEIDCVVCDLFLPDIDGFHVYQECQKIKRYNKYSIVQVPPFILLTSSTDPLHFREAQVLGFTACLSKPFEPKELEKALMLTGKVTSGDQVQTLIGKPQILVVDAQGKNHLFLKEFYADSEYQLIWLTAGYRCLEYLEQHHAQIKLVITDSQFPDMSIGEMLELAGQCTGDAKLPPFVLMTETAQHAELLPVDVQQQFAACLTLGMNPLDLRRRLALVLNPSSDARASLPTQNTLLIVDDLTFNAALIKNMLKHSTVLRSLGCKFVVANGGEEALEILKTDFSVFMVVSDLLMPHMDGMELLQAFNQFVSQDTYLSSEEYPKPQFFLFTGNWTPTTVQEAKAVGYRHVFQKPLLQEPFLEKIHEAVVESNLEQFAPKNGLEQMARAVQQEQNPTST